MIKYALNLWYWNQEIIDWFFFGNPSQMVAQIHLIQIWRVNFNFDNTQISYNGSLGAATKASDLTTNLKKIIFLLHLMGDVCCHSHGGWKWKGGNFSMNILIQTQFTARPQTDGHGLFGTTFKTCRSPAVHGPQVLQKMSSVLIIRGPFPLLT